MCSGYGPAPSDLGVAQAGVIAVPRAAQPAVLDRPLTGGSALVRAPVRQCPDPDRAVVGVAGPHAHAADRLRRRARATAAINGTLMLSRRRVGAAPCRHRGRPRSRSPRRDAARRRGRPRRAGPTSSLGRSVRGTPMAATGPWWPVRVGVQVVGADPGVDPVVPAGSIPSTCSPCGWSTISSPIDTPSRRSWPVAPPLLSCNTSTACGLWMRNAAPQQSRRSAAALHEARRTP